MAAVYPFRHERAPRSGPFGVPLAASRSEDALVLETVCLSGAELRHPFFVDSVERIRPDAGPPLVVPRAALREIPAEPALAPAGIIFHVSRCGSTLLANLLRQIPHVVGYSEPSAINDLLMPPFGFWQRAEVVGGLRAIARQSSRAANGGRYFVKLRSWQTLLAPLVLEAFPTSKWVFLTRDPVEVGVSVLRKPPAWLRAFDQSDNPFIPFAPETAAAASREDYIASMLGAFARSISDAWNDHGLMLHYEALPAAAWEIVSRHFGFAADAAAVARMRNCAQSYSKDPDGARSFEPDAAAKLGAAGPRLLAATCAHAAPRLDALVDSRS